MKKFNLYSIISINNYSDALYFVRLNNLYYCKRFLTQRISKKKFNKQSYLTRSINNNLLGLEISKHFKHN